MSEASSHGDVYKALASLVEKHHVGPQLPEVNVAGRQIEVEEAVAIHIAEVGAHGFGRISKVLLAGHVHESPTAVPSIKRRQLILQVSSSASDGHESRPLRCLTTPHAVDGQDSNSPRSAADV